MEVELLQVRLDKNNPATCMAVDFSGFTYGKVFV